MKKYAYYILPAAIVVLLMLLTFTAARAQDTCHVTAGPIYQVDGKTPANGAKITIVSADKQGFLILESARTYKTSPQGIVTFSVPRTRSGDTSFVVVSGDFKGGKIPRLCVVPNAATATLETLVDATGSYATCAVLVPGGGSTDTTYIYQAIAAAQLAAIANHGDSIHVADSLARIGAAKTDFYNAMGNAALLSMTSYGMVRNIKAGTGIAVDTLQDDNVAISSTITQGVTAAQLTDTLDANARLYVARRDSGEAVKGYATPTQLKLVRDLAAASSDSAGLAAAALPKIALDDSTAKFFRADSVTASDLNWGGTWQTMRVYKTITGANTFTFSNLPASGYSKTLIVTIYSGAGGGTVAWPANVRWSGGTAPTITATAGKFDVITLVWQGERGIVAGTFVQNFAE